MKKLSKTEAELKKALLIKESVYIICNQRFQIQFFAKQNSYFFNFYPFHP